MVADGISHFIQTGAAHNLDEAYNLAVMAHPTARQQFLDAQTAAALEAEDSARSRKGSEGQEGFLRECALNGPREGRATTWGH